jgi:predicted cobalt transporter CbtA
MSRTRQIAETMTVVVASVAVLPAVSLWPLLGAADNVDLSANEITWIAASTALGIALLAGLVLRLREQAPRSATGLMAIGAPAPAMAWFWLPPLYLLSAVLLVLALATHPRPSPAVAA